MSPIAGRQPEARIMLRCISGNALTVVLRLLKRTGSSGLYDDQLTVLGRREIKPEFLGWLTSVVQTTQPVADLPLILATEHGVPRQHQ